MRLPADHKAAAAQLIDQVVIQSPAYIKRCDPLRKGNPRKDVLHPVMRDFWEQMLLECQRRQLPFFWHCGLRTGAEQDALFKQGVTKARAGQSAHQYGMAGDLVHFGRYWNLTQKEWSVIGLIGKEVARRRNIKITWGGDWKFYDPAHWELTDWSNRVRNGEGQSA